MCHCLLLERLVDVVVVMVLCLGSVMKWSWLMQLNLGLMKVMRRVSMYSMSELDLMSSTVSLIPRWLSFWSSVRYQSVSGTSGIVDLSLSFR
ncbi:MAG: hypothetical protein HC930_06700 [Hydrococcus sp. SU_1_0]|nr:hypothetical protein [Hydrococcus sp. SU_1_0]